MLHIVLLEPRIPPNTGNIVRTCAALGASLHLIEPLGFSIDEASLRRAGLDYWDKAQVTVYRNIDHFFDTTGCADQIWLASTKAPRAYHQVSYQSPCWIMLGCETRGLPEALLYQHQSRVIRLPMRPGIRSLNLANTAAVLAFEVMRQWDFADLETQGRMAKENPGPTDTSQLIEEILMSATPESTIKIGLIGYGNMGSALLRGLAAKLPRLSLTVMEKDPTKAAQAKAEHAVTVIDDLAQICAQSEVLILAIKPQDAAAILADIKAYRYEGALLSVIAGKTTSWLAKLSGCPKVIRFMPSLSASIGRGAVGVCFANQVDQELKTFGLAAANAMGTAYEVPESLMSAITGTSGSGIAYAFAFLHGIAMGGVRSGLAYPTALAVAIDMTIGAAELLKQTGHHPQAMIANVCSPAGTTIEGINALEQGGFTGLCMDAVVAATVKSQDLEQ